MQVKFKAIWILFHLLISNLITAQNAPKYSNEFLSIGVGARALGMSGAFVSAVADVTSGYWNPAGLSGIDSKFQAALMHSEYFAGIAKFDYGSLAARIDNQSVLAFSVIRFGVDDIPDTSELIDANGNINYDRVSSFSAIDNAFLLSYGRQIKRLRLGGNLKVIHRRVGSFAKAWGFGLDAGFQLKMGKWQTAAIIRDASSTFNAWSFNLTESQRNALMATNNSLPENSVERTTPTIIAGLSRQISLGKKFEVLTELDLISTFDGMRNSLVRDKNISVNPMAGLEINYRKLVFLRGGVGNFASEPDNSGSGRIITFRPNMGLGLKFKGVALDYALTNIGASVFYSNIFSLSFQINKGSAPTEKQE